jgi:hypothetical protein
MDTQRFNHMVMALVVNANHVFAETIMGLDANALVRY